MESKDIYHELAELADLMESVEYGGTIWKDYQREYKSLKRKL